MGTHLDVLVFLVWFLCGCFGVYLLYKAVRIGM